LWDPRPIEYKTPRARARDAERIRRRQRGLEALLHQIVPFVPKPDHTRDTVRNIQEREGHERRSSTPPDAGTSDREARLDALADRLAAGASSARSREDERLD